MEVDCDVSAVTGGAHVTGIGNWGLSTIRESSLIMDDVIADDVMENGGVSMGYDTGYQTGAGSLLSAQQDSCQQHTNLTQQMGSLPLVDSMLHHSGHGSFVDDGFVAETPGGKQTRADDAVKNHGNPRHHNEQQQALCLPLEIHAHPASEIRVDF